MSSNAPASESIVVEVCVGSVAAARLAELAGADRIEVNSALELDGLTPSAGLLTRVVREIRIPMIAMARPRSGDYCYSEDEWLTLKSDVTWLLQNGADGVAFGCLDKNGQVDLRRCEEIRELAGTHPLVFHKAFDDAADWQTGLETLIKAGINRVMTSGQAPTAMEGLSILTAIVEQSAGRIEVLPAGRIGSGNASKIVAESGCDQVHGSFSACGPGNIGDEIRKTIDCL